MGEPARNLQPMLAADQGRSISDDEFRRLRCLVQQHTAISISDDKRDLLRNRLQKRLRALGLQSFADYCAIIESGQQPEVETFINAVTTNLTSFFREKHHFEFLANELRGDGTGTRRGPLRVWSAGCSSGEEPYSIAMTIRDAVPALSDVRVLATDLDTDMVAHGQRGVYDASRLEGLPGDLVQRWFMRGTSANAGKVRVKEDARSLVTFKQLNLIGPWPLRTRFTAIFCRNVVIYFDRETQQQLFDRFADQLEPGGLLFVGHSETLYQVCERFELLGNTVCRRIR